MSQVKPETINNNQPTQNDTEAKPINPPQSKDTKEAKESGKEETNKPRRFSVIMGLQNLGLNNNDDDDDDDYEEDEEEQRSNTRKRKRRRKKKDTSYDDNNKRATMRNATGTFRNSTSVINIAKEKEPEWKISIRKFLDSSPVQIVMTTFTIYILFADDIKMIATKKSADNGFSIICCILMGIFFIELILSSLVQIDYFLTFYFWLDFVSLISMVLDIHWFYNWMINSMSSGSSGGKQAKTLGAIAKAGKSAKIAARAIRILRILRIIRLVRVSKLYKAREKIIKIDLKKKELEQKREKEEREKAKKLAAEKAKKEAIEAQKAQIMALIEQNMKSGGEIDPNKITETLKNNASLKKNSTLRNTLKKNEDANNAHNNNNNNNNNNNKDPNNKNEQNKTEEQPNKSQAEKQEEEKKNEEEKKKQEEEDEKKAEEELEEEEEEEEEDDKKEGEVPEQSKVGKLLADRTSKKVIILVLAMMIGIILFNSNFYLEKKTGMEMGLKIFTNFDSMNDPDLNLTFSIYVSENLGTDSPLVYLKVGNLVQGSQEEADSLRTQEKNKYSEVCSTLDPADTSSTYCEATFDISKANRLSAILNIIKTCFICVVLTFGSFCFSKDTQEMVLEPIEAMIEKVKQISKNPIEALQKNEKDEITKAILEEEEKKQALCGCFGDDKNQPNSNYVRHKKEIPLETEMLENTITKIGALLALSFGDAGSEIIAKNMQKNSSGEVNPMIAGKKVMAIYGFCDIRNFTDTTEILQEKVMVFVNEIAEIVHENISEYGGSANKNIGDAFLLVWKFDDKFTYTSKKTKEICVYNCEQVNQLCDMSLISIIKIFAKIYKSKTLDKYRKNDKLNKKFGGYSVKIGFGIHLGWSIEGAIGSTFKIDASYLSPNANMANGCEERTKEYGAVVIMTDKFVENLSEECQKYVRMIDIINGDEQLGLYTVDFDLTALTIDEEESESQQFFNDDPAKNSAAMRKMMKYQKRMKRNKNLADAMSFPPKRDFWGDFIENSEDWSLMRAPFTDTFYSYYNEGFDEFNFGDWDKARQFLNAALKLRKDDRPTQKILDKMKSYNWKKPNNWIGNTE